MELAFFLRELHRPVFPARYSMHKKKKNMPSGQFFEGFIDWLHSTRRQDVLELLAKPTPGARHCFLATPPPSEKDCV